MGIILSPSKTIYIKLDIIYLKIGRKLIFYLKTIFLLLSISSFLLSSNINPITLTPSEREFIQKHPTLVLGSNRGWEPYVIEEDGKVIGYDNDILSLITSISGLKFKIKLGIWGDMVNLVKDKKIDGLTTSAVHKERKDYLNFSIPYNSMQKMIITSKINPKNINSLKDLDGKIIAIQKGNLLDEKSAKRFKNSTILRVDTSTDVVVSVVTGKADAMFGNGASQYFARKLGFPYLRLAIGLDERIELVFSIRDDYPEAISIINKALAIIGTQKLSQIRDKWFMLSDTPLYKKLDLTEIEKKYLFDKKEIKMCVDPDWLPFEKIEKGKYIGIGSEYMRLLQEGIQTPIRLIPTKTWSESLGKSMSRECDILAMAEQTDSREEYMDFTSAYIKAPIVVATKSGLPFVDNIEQILDKKLGVVRNYSFYEKLKIKYPHIKLIEVNSAYDGLKKVESGKLFGYLDNSIVINDLIQKEFVGTIAITGKFKEDISLGIASRNDETILGKILEKFVLSIDLVTKDSIYSKWVKLTYLDNIDYTLVYQIIFIALLMLSGTIYWNRRLNAEINRRKYAERELKKVNSNLEDSIKEAVEEIHYKEILLQNQSRLAQMGEMIAMIAHQWRQPLSAINSAIVNIEVKQNFQYKKLDDKENRDKFLLYNTQKLNQIEGYVSFLSETIDNFRDFFNLDKNKIDCSINKTIEMALTIIQSSFDNKGIKISKELDEDSKITIYKNEIIQVILNILINSKDNFEQSDRKNPLIIINTSKIDDTLCISIYDNGGGVSEDILVNIFDPYFSTKSIKNGTGLGLYMSKTIIEEHHKGRLDVNNILDGVKFDIILPL